MTATQLRPTPRLAAALAGDPALAGDAPPGAWRPPSSDRERGRNPVAPVACPVVAAKRPPRPRRMSAVPVERLGLFNRRWQRALHAAGVQTAADLLARDAQRLVRQLEMPESAALAITRRQAAIRLAALLPPLNPRSALLLIAVHRRDLRKLAAESPGRLHRDLTRFALSSPGQALLRGQPVPDLEAVRRWVLAAQERCGRRKDGSEVRRFQAGQASSLSFP